MTATPLRGEGFPSADRFIREAGHLMPTDIATDELAVFGLSTDERDELIRLHADLAPAATPTDGPRLHVVSLDEFADEDEEGAAALMGDTDGALVPENGDVMFYGDGGAGKTTLCIDLACHLAAGDDWLNVAVARPARVLIIENEGPRPLFRAKLRRKRDGWTGSPLGDRIDILEAPWGALSFADPAWRATLAATVSAREIDVVIVGPITRSGMDEAGTLQEVRDFMALVGEVRALAGRPVTFVLVHHENKGGKVSGAWEAAGDTLFHVQAQGHGRTRLHIQKARWSSEHHGITLQLVWTDGDGFALEETEELDDATVAEQIHAAIRANPGLTWTKLVKATPGVGTDRRMAVRDGLLRSGRIVNVGRAAKGGEKLALAYVPERLAAGLFLADDPTIRHLLPARGADGEQIAPATGAKPNLHLLPAPRLIGGADGAETDATPPDDLDWR